MKLILVTLLYVISNQAFGSSIKVQTYAVENEGIVQACLEASHQCDLQVYSNHYICQKGGGSFQVTQACNESGQGVQGQGFYCQFDSELSCTK